MPAKKQIKFGISKPEFSMTRVKEIADILIKDKIAEGMTPEKLVKLLEDLGPTYVKMGQIMSMRSDMLPMEYCKALSQLRSNVAPLDLETVKSTIEKELGKPVDELFAEFDDKPLGSASIGQVHKAVMKDGEQVVVKVQRPGIYDKMKNDVEILRAAAGMIQLTSGIEKDDFNSMLDEMWNATSVEMDFLHEANNIKKFHDLNSSVDYVTCPKVYPECTNKHILTMTNMQGYQIDAVDDITKAGYDIHTLGSELAENYVKQVVTDRYFHADPHPGNIMVCDGGKIGWIDMGTMGELSKSLANGIMDLLTSVVLHDTDGLVDTIMNVFPARGDVDKIGFTKIVNRIMATYGAEDLGSIDVGMLITDVTEACKDYDFAIPDGITILGKSLLTIEGTLADVDPTVNLMAVLTKFIQENSSQEDPVQMLKDNALKLAGDVKRTMRAPVDLASVIRLLKDGDLKMQLELTDSKRNQNNRLEYSDNQTASILTLACFTLAGLLGHANKREKGTIGAAAKLFIAAGSAFMGYIVAKFFMREN